MNNKEFCLNIIKEYHKEKGFDGDFDALTSDLETVYLSTLSLLITERNRIKVSKKDVLYLLDYPILPHRCVECGRRLWFEKAWYLPLDRSYLCFECRHNKLSF